MNRITILLSDGQALTTAGLKYILSGNEDVEIVAQVSNRKHLIEAIQQYNPALLIIDYKQTTHFQVNDFFLIKEKHPHTRVLVISSDDHTEDILSVLKSGVQGFITKQCSQEEIVHALHAVAAGEKFFCNKVFDVLMESQLRQDEPAAQPANLTSRETQIITLIAQGNSTVEIADQLSLSYHTINSHRKSILKKLNIKSPAELIIYAIDTGLVKLK
jgi:two-component system, NarL family, invasion response regulator UvrY